jgi:hypothetical protein
VRNDPAARSEPAKALMMKGKAANSHRNEVNQKSKNWGEQKQAEVTAS